MFHTENPKILGATVQNIVVGAICHSGFKHPSMYLSFFIKSGVTYNSKKLGYYIIYNYKPLFYE